MRPFRFHHIMAAGFALLLLPMPARADVEKTSMALPAVAPIFALEWIAQDAGIYKEVGLDVAEQMVRGVGATNAVISGSLDFANSSGSTLTRAVAKDQPIIGIATTYDRTGFWIIVNKKIADERHFDPKAPLAERAKILKGLRFSVGSLQTLPHAYLNAVAKIGGLNPDTDIVAAPITLADTLPAMATGSIDGASIGPPAVYQALKSGTAVVVADGTTGNPIDPPWLTRIDSIVIIARKDTCTARRSVCVKMGEALVKAAAYMHDRPRESEAIIGKRLNFFEPDALRNMYEVTAESTPRSPAVSAKGLETADQLNVDAGFMAADQKLPSYDKLFDNEFVSSAR
ncbi:MAG TPA: ABC transporter substrate-binding protein [Stellaceae bacterium]|jgi:ABC-type nitrate/sulfonate/bicarbonate transport system substrate-binding protein|nr:ABC transporter substrate-binding protein [Stellaceae bacterium]